MSERQIVSSLNLALEITCNLSRQDEDGDGCDAGVMTLTSRLGY